MEKKHKRSEELLRGQIKEDENNYFAHLNLAQLLRAKGDYAGCIHHSSRVVEITESFVDESIPYQAQFKDEGENPSHRNGLHS